jgi:hypothetical protein
MPELGVASKKNTESFQPLWNTLGVIHAVDAQNQEFVIEFMAKLISGVFNLVAGSMVGEFFEGNADRKGSNPGPLPFDSDSVVGIFANAGGFRKDPLQAAEKVVAITVGLKSQ